MSAAVTRCHSHLLGASTEPLTFRVRGSEHHGRMLRIQSSKCLIGSAPGCTLRLRAAGLSPYHCLIVRGEAGVFARRWSPDTCLNGQSFEHSRLLPGDRLEIGPIVLEFVEPDPAAKNAPREPIAPPSEAGEPHAPRPETAFGGELTADESAQQPPPTPGPDWAEQRNQAQRERDELDRRCEALTGQLAEAQHTRQELQTSLDQIRQTASQKQAGYLAALEEVRNELSLLRRRHDQQLTHQEELVRQAQAAGSEVQALREQLRAVGQHAESEERERTEEDRRIQEELRQYNQQNTSLAAQLQIKEQQWSEQALKWETTEQELRGQLQATLNDLDESRRRLEELTAHVRETSQQLNGGNAEPSQTTVNPAAPQDPASPPEGEVIRRLREELDQSREEHRKAREEWHRDRRNLEQELTVHHEPPSAAESSALAETACFPTDQYVAKPAADRPASPPHETSACSTQLMDREELVQLRLADPQTPETPTLVLSPDQLTSAAQDYPLRSSGTETSPHKTPAHPPTGGELVQPCPPSQVSDTPEDDEGVIQQYMARLLQRVAGTAPAENASSVTPGPTGTSDVRPNPVDSTRPESVTDRSADVEPPQRDASAEAKPAAPAMVADLLAMRELANRSTRRAIDDSDQRRQVARATSELVVALACTAAGAVMAVTSQHPLSPQALAGALGLCVGGMILIRASRSLWSCCGGKRKGEAPDADA